MDVVHVACIKWYFFPFAFSTLLFSYLKFYVFLNYKMKVQYQLSLCSLLIHNLFLFRKWNFRYLNNCFLTSSMHAPSLSLLHHSSSSPSSLICQAPWAKVAICVTFAPLFLLWTSASPPIIVIMICNVYLLYSLSQLLISLQFVFQEKST